jgi:hypothetical protein
MAARHGAKSIMAQIHNSLRMYALLLVLAIIATESKPRTTVEIATGSTEMDMMSWQAVAQYLRFHPVSVIQAVIPMDHIL